MDFFKLLSRGYFRLVSDEEFLWCLVSLLAIKPAIIKLLPIYKAAYHTVPYGIKKKLNYKNSSG